MRAFPQTSVIGSLLEPWMLRLAVIGFEIVTIHRLSADKYLPFREEGDSLRWLLHLTPASIKAAVVSMAATVLLYLLRADAADQKLLRAYVPGRLNWIVNIVLFFLTLFMTYGLSAGRNMVGFPGHLFPLFVASVWCGMLLSWASLLAPLSRWREFIAEFYPILGVVYGLIFFSYHGLDALISAELGKILIAPTLSLSSAFYSLTGDEVSIVGWSPRGNPIFGNFDFFVEIKPECSGYEGIFLSSIILFMYFIIDNTRISRFSMAATLVAVTFSMFLLNAVRLAILSYVGTHLSHDIAVKGFHTNFGILTLVIVLGLAFLFTQLSSARFRVPSPALRKLGSNDERLLIPLIALIGASLVVGLFSGKFFWLYPIPIFAAAVAFYFIRLDLSDLRQSFSPFVVTLAIATFVMWISIVPIDRDASAVFADHLFSVPLLASVTWMFLRVVGSAVVVPMVEELAFRGALFSFVLGLFKAEQTRLSSKAAAVAATSVVFGLVHEDIVAGILAGCAFGAARLQRDRLGDAVACHGLTNFFLCLYVLATGYWSYWL